MRLLCIATSTVLILTCAQATLCIVLVYCQQQIKTSSIEAIIYDNIVVYVVAYNIHCIHVHDEDLELLYIAEEGIYPGFF